MKLIAGRKISLILIIILTFGSVLGYSMRDAINSLGPGKNGSKSGLEMVRLWNKLANTKFGKRADNFFTYLNEAVKDFDWESLYESKYLSGRRGGFRTITLRGLNKPNHYRVDVINGRYTSVPMTKLGNIGTEYGFKENKVSVSGDSSYSAYVKMRVALKQFSHINGTAFLTGLQKIISPGNLEKLNDPKTTVYKNLKGESRKLIDNFTRHLPKWSKNLAKYTYLKSLVTIKEYKGERYTKLKMVMGLSMRGIKRDFPELEDWLDSIAGLMKFRYYVNNRKGNRLLIFSLDTKRRLFKWELYTRGGKLIPMTYKKKPVFSQEFDLSKIKKYVFYNVFNLKIAIFGIRFYTGNIVVRGTYRRSKSNGRFYLHFTRLPIPKVKGRAFGIFPKWMMDMAIPGNIEELAGKVMKVMEKGNNGRGTRMAARWNTRRPNNTIFNLKASSEFVDNFFIRFALKIFSRKFRPSNDALDDIDKFYEKMSGALMTDMKRMSKT